MLLFVKTAMRNESFSHHHYLHAKLDESFKLLLQNAFYNFESLC